MRCIFFNSLAFSVIQWLLAIWSLIPMPLQNPACTSWNSQFTYSWSLAWRDFVHYLANMWDEYNCSDYVLAYTYVFKCITLDVYLYVCLLNLTKNVYEGSLKWLMYFININICWTKPYLYSSNRYKYNSLLLSSLCIIYSGKFPYAFKENTNGTLEKSWHIEVILCKYTNKHIRLYMKWRALQVLWLCQFLFNLDLFSWDLSPFSVFGFLQLIFLGGGGSGNDSSSFSFFLFLFYFSSCSVPLLWLALNQLHFFVYLYQMMFYNDKDITYCSNQFLCSFVGIGLVSQWYSKRYFFNQKNGKV